MTRDEWLEMAKALTLDGRHRESARAALGAIARIAQHLAEQPDHAQRADAAGEHAKAYAEVCHALGIEWVQDTGPSYPGPLADVLREIEQLQAAANHHQEERDAAYARLVELEKERDLLRGSVDDYKRAMDDARSERNAERAAIDEAWKAAAVPVRGMVSLADVIADLREKRDEARAELNQLAARGAGDDAYIEGLREGIADAQAEAIAMVDLLRNLVAVIDRDGGQRQDGEHISVTAARATETVVGMIQQLDNTAAEIVPRLTKERDEARGAADKLGADAYRLCYVISLIRQWANTYGADLVPPGVDTYGEGKRDAKRAVRNILNAAPPAEIVPPKPATEARPPDCNVCNDTRLMPHRGRRVMCTACPLPCAKCRQGANKPGAGLGPYCQVTPCPCACHLPEPPAEVVPPKPAEATVDTSEEWTERRWEEWYERNTDDNGLPDARAVALLNQVRRDAHAAGRREGLEEAAKECEAASRERPAQDACDCPDSRDDDRRRAGHLFAMAARIRKLGGGE